MGGLLGWSFATVTVAWQVHGRSPLSIVLWCGATGLLRVRLPAPNIHLEPRRTEILLNAAATIISELILATSRPQFFLPRRKNSQLVHRRDPSNFTAGYGSPGKFPFVAGKESSSWTRLAPRRRTGEKIPSKYLARVSSSAASYAPFPTSE